MNPAIFLDRDGVIIENRADYVRSWRDVEIYPYTMRVLARLAKTPNKIILVTNQSAVGRGLVPLETVRQINQRLVKLIEHAGGRIDGVYVCPHAPEAACDCRKPEPGMLLQAAADHQIDMGASLMVGDAITDLEAAQAAGIPRLILVRSGRGRAQEQLLESKVFANLQIFDDLEGAMLSVGDDADLQG